MHFITHLIPTGHRSILQKECSEAKKKTAEHNQEMKDRIEKEIEEGVDVLRSLLVPWRTLLYDLSPNKTTMWFYEFRSRPHPQVGAGSVSWHDVTCSP
jgi:hypothetical protein